MAQDEDIDTGDTSLDEQDLPYRDTGGTGLEDDDMVDIDRDAV